MHNVPNGQTYLRPAALLNKSLWHRCLPVNFAKFLRTRFLQNISGRPLLSVKLYYELHWRESRSMLRSRLSEVFCKKDALKLWQCLFFNKTSACNFIKKETLSLVFSCGFWEIFKNIFFL